jgi:predicted DNA-binding transcriptional regulator YafY
VPVYYDEGYRLLSESFLANLTFTAEELLALKLGVQMQALAQGSHLGAATKSALAKIEEQLARRSLGNDNGEEEAITVHIKAHPLNGKTVKTLKTLEAAIKTRRPVDLRYYSLSSDEKRKRTVDPYGLTFRRHSWYVVGYCHFRRTARVFRLDRIFEAKLKPGKFERPEGFSIESFFEDSWEVFASGKKMTAVLRFNRWAKAIAEPMLSHRGEFKPGPDGSWLFEGDLPHSDELNRWLMTLGSEVEVLEPAALREEIATKLREAASLYG